VTRDEAWKLANHWLAAWNAHDLGLIMTHYEDAIELTSPVAAQLLGKPMQGSRKSKFARLLSARAGSLPALHFRLETCSGASTAWCSSYTNHKGTRTAEFMELSATGKVTRVVANYSAYRSPPD